MTRTSRSTSRPGRPLAERLGYPAAGLDLIPGESIDSFAGVGYFFDLAAPAAGETVLDLGSGSGMDSFLAALAVGPSGTVIGVDMTGAQLEKSRRLATGNVEFRQGYIEEPRQGSVGEVTVTKWGSRCVSSGSTSYSSTSPLRRCTMCLAMGSHSGGDLVAVGVGVCVRDRDLVRFGFFRRSARVGRRRCCRPAMIVRPRGRCSITHSGQQSRRRRSPPTTRRPTCGDRRTASGGAVGGRARGGRTWPAAADRAAGRTGTQG